VQLLSEVALYAGTSRELMLLHSAPAAIAEVIAQSCRAASSLAALQTKYIVISRFQQRGAAGAALCQRRRAGCVSRRCVMKLRNLIVGQRNDAVMGTTS